MTAVVKGNFPHIEWVDLNNDGTLIEVAVFKRDELGNLYYIRVDQLDAVDKSRLVKVLQNRNVEMYELWDLMSNVTLGNGVNALDYFHQLVKVLTPQGKIMKPMLGSIGIRLAELDEGPRKAPQETTAKKAKRGKKAAAEEAGDESEE